MFNLIDLLVVVSSFSLRLTSCLSNDLGAVAPFSRASRQAIRYVVRYATGLMANAQKDHDEDAELLKQNFVCHGIVKAQKRCDELPGLDLQSFCPSQVAIRGILPLPFSN